MRLEEFETYDLSIELGEEVWAIVNKWDFFNRDTIGKQVVRSVDSVAANLSEGLGRHFFKETRNFAYYSRGSLLETKTWLGKARRRALISDLEYENLESRIRNIEVKLNNYIRSLGNKSMQSSN